MLIHAAVVEDDKMIRESLIRLLNESPGFKCSASYEDAESAEKGIPALVPDVVLMDINLPGKSGIECVRTIKTRRPELLIVMLTVYEDTGNIFRSLEAGAVGYLLKSTDPDQILTAIKDVMAGGSPMSAQIARKVVQAFQKKKDTENDLLKLTGREREILDLLAGGFLYKEIADKLLISHDTVHNHLRRIYEKLHVRSRTEAVVKYMQN